MSAALDPGERLIAEVKPGFARAMAGSRMFLILFAAIQFAMMLANREFGVEHWVALAVRCVVVGVIWAIVTMVLTRRSHWLLTDRRLIEVNRNRAVDLAQVHNARATRIGSNVGVILTDGRAVFIAAVPHANDFAARILAARDAAGAEPEHSRENDYDL